MSKLAGTAVAVMSIAIGSMVLATLPASAEGGTIRIEPRPYHGAIVTLEAGVRVFRPLPPTRYVIINPNGQTPVQLGINETRVYQKSRSRNYHTHEHRGGYAGRNPSFGAYGDYRGIFSGGCIPAVGASC